MSDSRPSRLADRGRLLCTLGAIYAVCVLPGLSQARSEWERYGMLSVPVTLVVAGLALQAWARR